MTVRISQTAEVQQFFEKASGFDQPAGSQRMKHVVHRVLNDSIKIIEDLEITPKNSGRRSITSMTWAAGKKRG